ncbi:PAS domain-containing protein [Belliella kenyensis]|uniref:PAS domain-containing protein n=1 Tax=Belliella kenyensis TaxID=1472724 RepID=A0ABV8ELD5_9BACT|nr:PAS domain-containing protein [Belliella kenyensis]MCH7400259.1 PAS domain-containing protein [Belliella kenyensis]MDN3604724.1 PAS domain-containing protein [Belliella kenyensis]
MSELEKVKFPLWCWDIVGEQRSSDAAIIKKNAEFRFLTKLSQDHAWVIDWNILFEYDYEAIVITDQFQQIIWVNDGFKQMTGYNKSFAIGKRPRILQGKHTTQVSRTNIKSKLKLGISFTESIINYRIDKSSYHCELTIHPIKNDQEIIVAFIAFEKEIL